MRYSICSWLIDSVLFCLLITGFIRLMSSRTRCCFVSPSFDLNLPCELDESSRPVGESSASPAVVVGDSSSNSCKCNEFCCVIGAKRRRLNLAGDVDGSEECVSIVRENLRASDFVGRGRAVYCDKPANVICRVEELGKLISSFDDRKKGWVVEMGFGGLLHAVNIKLPRPLCYWLMSRIDPANELLRVGGVIFRLTANQVRWVLGLPKGDVPVPAYFPSEESFNKIVELEEKYGKVWSRPEGRAGKVVTRRGFSVKHGVIDRLMSVFEWDEAYEFKALFLMVALDMVLCPTQCSRFPKELLPAVSCADHAKTYDWCGLVLNKLMASAKRFASRFSSAGYVGGCGGCTLFLALFYFDHLKRSPVHWGTRPRISVWNHVQIKLALEADRDSDDGDFGGAGVLDIAYGETHPFEARDVDCPSDDDEFVIS